MLSRSFNFEKSKAFSNLIKNKIDIININSIYSNYPNETRNTNKLDLLYKKTALVVNSHIGKNRRNSRFQCGFEAHPRTSGFFRRFYALNYCYFEQKTVQSIQIICSFSFV